MCQGYSTKQKPCVSLRGKGELIEFSGKAYQGWKTLMRYGDGAKGEGNLQAALNWLRVIWFIWGTCSGFRREQGKIYSRTLLVFMDNNLLPEREQRNTFGFT